MDFLVVVIVLICLVVSIGAGIFSANPKSVLLRFGIRCGGGLLVGIIVTAAPISIMGVSVDGYFAGLGAWIWRYLSDQSCA